MHENPHTWFHDFDQAVNSARAQGKALLLQFHRDECAGCKKLYAQTYTDEAVARELHTWFVPLRQDILKDRVIRSRYSAYWTPSFYFLDTNGKMYLFFNGFFNAEDFRVILRLGKAAIDIPRGRYFESMDLMNDGLQKFPDNPRAASMLFTYGMAQYLAAKEKSVFRETMREICQRYPQSPEARMWPWMDTP